MGNRPEWDISAAYGDDGEDTVRALLDLRGAALEVKHKHRHDLGLYVEQQCAAFGARDQYRDSGITITRADYWAYVIGESGIVLLLPTARLRAAVAHPSARPARCETDPRYPTRGKLVHLAAILGQCT